MTTFPRSRRKNNCKLVFFIFSIFNKVRNFFEVGSFVYRSYVYYCMNNEIITTVVDDDYFRHRYFFSIVQFTWALVWIPRDPAELATAR